MNIKYIRTTDKKKYDLRDKRITDTDTGIATQSANGLLSSGDKKKLDGIASGSEVNVQANWNETNTSSDAYIQNKPSSLPASDVSAWAKASTKPSYGWSEITDKPSFATVATSGSYNDLNNKPTIPADQDIDAYAADFSLHGDEIIYYSSEKLVTTTSTKSSGIHINSFFNGQGDSVQITQHTWANGVGRIVFAGDITTIGDYAFYGCTFYKVKLPQSVASLGRYAFGLCNLLESVNISKVQTIGEYAFYYCYNLQIHTIKCKIVSSYAFAQCYSINSITLTSTEDIVIGDYAFAYCSSLQSVTRSTISANVVTIGEHAFAQCYSLTSVNFDINSVGNYAFSYCRSLVYCELPNCSQIGNRAFEYCYSLNTIHVSSNSVTRLGTDAFDHTHNLSRIIVPSSLVSAYKTASNWSSYSSIIISD